MIARFGGLDGTRLFFAGLYRRGTRRMYLIAAAIAFGAVALRDWHAADALGVDLADALELAVRSGWNETVWWSLGGGLIYVGLGPCLVGLFELLIPAQWDRRHEPRRYSDRLWWLGFILSLCSAIAMSWLSTSISSIAGPSLTVTGVEHAFSSWSAIVVDLRVGQVLRWVAAAGVVLFGVGWSVLANLITESGVNTLVKKYKRTQLLGLRWPRMPRGGRIEFDIARLAPQLPELIRRVEKEVGDEDRAGSLIRGGEGRLQAVGDEIASLLDVLSYAPREWRDQYELEFVTSMWRGLEIALLRQPRGGIIVLSPWERQEAAQVAQHAAKLLGSKLVVLGPASSYISGTTREIVARVATEAAAQVRSIRQATRVKLCFVISAVDQVSGRVLPVEATAAALEAACGDCTLDTIVDASHAVANLGGRLPAVRFAACLIATHKWLMSPQRGCVVWTRSDTSAAYRPLDSWKKAVQHGRVDLRGLLLMRGVLQFWTHFSTETIEDRLKNLRAELVDALKPEIVEAYTESDLLRTGIVVVQPAATHIWRRSDAALQDALRLAGLQCAIVPFRGGTADEPSVVRLCVSTVTEGWQVLKAASILRGLVRPTS